MSATFPTKEANAACAAGRKAGGQMAFKKISSKLFVVQNEVKIGACCIIKVVLLKRLRWMEAGGEMKYR